jgi:hypothetical protein
MDKIKIDIFDILGYLVPGSALLLIGWVAADSEVKSVWETYKSLQKIDTNTIYIGIFIAYFFGFVLHIAGSYLYGLHLRLGNKAKLQSEQLSNAEKWTLIREEGEKHLQILERWYALRAFSQNLTAISAICGLICLYKWYAFGYYEWGLFVLLFVVLYFILMKRADVFNEVLHTDMKAVIDKLKGKQK